jgi:hypothetical protein
MVGSLVDAIEQAGTFISAGSIGTECVRNLERHQIPALDDLNGMDSCDVTLGRTCRNAISADWIIIHVR